MTEEAGGRVVGRAAALSALDIAKLLYSLCLCAPMIFVIGTFTVIATGVLYRIYHPEQWVGTLPSISGSSSEPPTSIFFMWLMMPTAFCIVAAWTVKLVMDWQRVGALPASRQRVVLAALNVATWSAGALAGLALAALAIVSLGKGHDFHMASSYVFYIAQLVSFILDGVAVVGLRRAGIGADGPFGRSTARGKLLVGGTCLVAGLFFCFMYNVRAFVPAASLYTAQEIYVASEYLVALACFAYPLTSYREARAYFRALL